MIVESPRCAYLRSNVTGIDVIRRCPASGTFEVLVPVKAAGGMFFGAGVRALVCREHVVELLDKYAGRLP
jgi:hypothetical protein